MMEKTDREKFIRDDSEFRGWVIATLESASATQERFEKNLKDHLNVEMLKFDDLIRRVDGLEQWKIRVTVVSSVLGAIIGFIISNIPSWIL